MRGGQQQPDRDPWQQKQHKGDGQSSEQRFPFARQGVGGKQRPRPYFGGGGETKTYGAGVSQ